MYLPDYPPFICIPGKMKLKELWMLGVIFGTEESKGN
jgi:hypothetical protein